MTLQETLNQLDDLIHAASQDTDTAHQILRDQYLGRRGRLDNILSRTGALTPADRETVRQKALEVKTKLEAILPR